MDKLIDTVEKELNKKLCIEIYEKTVQEQLEINKQLGQECLSGAWKFETNINGLVLFQKEMKNTYQHNFVYTKGGYTLKLIEPGCYIVYLYIMFNLDSAIPFSLDINDEPVYRLLRGIKSGENADKGNFFKIKNMEVENNNSFGEAINIDEKPANDLEAENPKNVTLEKDELDIFSSSTNPLRKHSMDRKSHISQKSAISLKSALVDPIGRMSRFEHFCTQKIILVKKNEENSNRVSLSLSENIKCNGYLVI